MDFPIKNGGSFHSFFYVYQRVKPMVFHHSKSHRSPRFSPRSAGTAPGRRRYFRSMDKGLISWKKASASVERRLRNRGASLFSKGRAVGEPKVWGRWEDDGKTMGKHGKTMKHLYIHHIYIYDIYGLVRFFR